jgi:LCP family protein required for cell wall assembly
VTTPSASSGSPQPSGGGLRLSRRGRILKWTAIGVAAVVVIVTGAVVGDYYYLNAKITTDQRYEPPGYVPPTKAATATKAENFVLIGSDSRAGASGKGTGGSKIAGARSDTTIILHISANNAGATLISIPRDSYVQIPTCVVGPDNKTSAPEMSKFNAAFSLGGEFDPKYAPSCTVHTIETLTGIPIDHFAVINFAGFEKMVEALGGVKMCVARALVDPVVDDNGAYHGSNLNLPAGKSVEIDGAQALALMRARYALDGGGDLPRIKRQQEFIGAMIRKATSTSLLVDPLKLQRFLSAAASSLTTDGFHLGTMKKLASALHNVGAGGVRLLTVPTVTSFPGMPYGDVAWDPAKAPALWQAIRDDTPIPGTAKPKPTTSPTPTPTGPPLTVAPADISVNVENGTTTPGLAHTVATQLEAQGFHVVNAGDAPKDTYTSTVVQFGSAKVQSSQTVAASIPGSIRRADATAGSATITIIVGSTFTNVVAVTLTGATPTPSATPSIATISAAKPGCLS